MSHRYSPSVLLLCGLSLLLITSCFGLHAGRANYDPTKEKISPTYRAEPSKIPGPALVMPFIECPTNKYQLRPYPSVRDMYRVTYARDMWRSLGQEGKPIFQPHDQNNAWCNRLIRTIETDWERDPLLAESVEDALAGTDNQSLLVNLYVVLWDCQYETYYDLYGRPFKKCWETGGVRMKTFLLDKQGNLLWYAISSCGQYTKAGCHSMKSQSQKAVNYALKGFPRHVLDPEASQDEEAEPEPKATKKSRK